MLRQTDQAFGEEQRPLFIAHFIGSTARERSTIRELHTLDHFTTMHRQPTRRADPESHTTA
jgi:hypothetical protein